MNHKLKNYKSTDGYILHNVATYKWTGYNGNIEIISFVVQFLSSMSFRDVDHDLKLLFDFLRNLCMSSASYE